MLGSSKQFLVTGGCGFIGSNVALALQKSGAEVVALDSYLTGNGENISGVGIPHVVADLTNENVWKSSELLNRQWNAIFHHGDITDPRYSDDKAVYERNVGGFRRVLELAQAVKCRVIFASTAGLYGNGAVPMQEDQEKDILTAYGKSKLEMERLAEEASTRIPVVALRYFNVYGPREAHKGRAASMVYHLYQQMRAGRRPRLFEFGEQKRDFVYVKDVTSANIAALTAPSGIYNVGSGVASDFNALVAALNAAMKCSLATEYFPMPYDPKTYQGNTHAEMTRAKTVLGFTPRWSLEAGVADYVQWLEQTRAVAPSEVAVATL